MELPTQTSFDSETLAVLTKAFSAVWDEARHQNLTAERESARATIASILLVAASDGERDPEQLKAIALEAIGGLIR